MFLRNWEYVLLLHDLLLQWSLKITLAKNDVVIAVQTRKQAILSTSNMWIDNALAESAHSKSKDEADRLYLIVGNYNSFLSLP